MRWSALVMNCHQDIAVPARAGSVEAATKKTSVPAKTNVEARAKYCNTITPHPNTEK
jgi:hypothetical protein